MVKNAVIVPVGAKGGFVVQAAARPTRPTATPWLAEGIACYRTFISGLLDITDNLVDGDGRAAARASSATTATTPTSSSPPTRAPRRSPTSPTASRRTTASGSATRSRPAARSATTTRRWASPPAAPGSRSSGTSASCGIDTQTRGLHRRRHRRHVRRRVRQRHAAVRAHPAGRRVRPPAHLPRPRPRRRRRRTPSASGCSTCRARRWADYDTQPDLRGRRRLPAHRRSRSRSRRRCATRSASTPATSRR